MGYLDNTAASVRLQGIKKSGQLAEAFGQDWILVEYIPVVVNKYAADKKGYNYRMCCLYSLAAVMPYTPKDAITQHIVPELIKASKDDIPNVKFTVSKIIIENKQYIDQNVMINQLVGPLKEMQQDADKDVAYFSAVALQTLNTKYD